MNKKIEARACLFRHYDVELHDTSIFYLDNLINSIANWHYACDEAEECTAEDGEISLHWYTRKCAATDVLNDMDILAEHCAHNEIENESFWKYVNKWLDRADCVIHTEHKMREGQHS